MAVQVITLGIDDSEYRRGLRSVDRQFQGFGRSASRIGGLMGKVFLGGSALALAARGFRTLIKEGQELQGVLDGNAEAIKRFEGSVSSIAAMGQSINALGSWAGSAGRSLLDRGLGAAGWDPIRRQLEQDANRSSQRFYLDQAHQLRRSLERDAGIAAGTTTVAREEEKGRQREISQAIADISARLGPEVRDAIVSSLRAAEAVRSAAVAKQLDKQEAKGRGGGVFAIASGAGGALIGRQAFGFPGARVSLGIAAPGATSVAAQRAALISEWRTLGVNRPGMTDAELKEQTKRLDQIREELQKLNRKKGASYN